MQIFTESWHVFSGIVFFLVSILCPYECGAQSEHERNGYGSAKRKHDVSGEWRRTKRPAAELQIPGWLSGSIITMRMAP